MPTWLAWILAVTVKAISLTYRVRFDDPDGWLEQKENWPAVAAIWHNRILFVAALVSRKILKRTTVLISSSRDGEYVSSFIRFFGLGVVRGSSSRGGVHALLGLGSAIEEGRTPILTVDGPRGPKYTVHQGAIILAEKYKVPIIPAAVNAKSFWQLKSWDNTQIPKPFTKVTISIGHPVFLPEGIDREEAAKLLKQKMMDITDDSGNRAYQKKTE